MRKEEITDKIQRKMSMVCERRFLDNRCSGACEGCPFKLMTDFLIEEMEDYY